MSKFAVNKRFELGFVSDLWAEKGAYLEFEAFTVKDVKERLSKLAQVDQEDSKEVTAGLDEMIDLLTDKFVGGKAVNSDGTLIDLKKEDLSDLPVEIVAKAVSFLSQGLSNNA